MPISQACRGHDPRQYVSERVGAGVYRVHCGRCGTFLGYHDEQTETRNHNGPAPARSPRPRPPKAFARKER